MQLSGGGGGAFGTLGAGAIGGAAALLGGAGAGKFITGLFGGGKDKTMPATKGKSGGFTPPKGLKAAGILGTLLSLPGIFDAFSSGDPEAIGSNIGSLGGGLLGGFLGSFASPILGTGAGAILGSTLGGEFGGWVGSTLFGGGTGDGSEADANGGGLYNPLASMHINAPYLQNREGTSVDGKPTQKQHKGVDLRGKTGDSVRAIKGGVVEISKDGAGSYGKYVKIKHDDGHRSVYAHLNKRLVSSGAQVRAGQEIGHVGSTGQSSGPHLHLEVWNGTNQDAHVDPLAYLSGAGSAVAAGVHSNDASATAITNKSLLFGESQGQLLPGMSSSSGIGGGSEAGSSGGISYGGVNINITVPKNTAINEQTLAREIKRVLNDQDMLQKAVSR
jgi:hypothetical protein